MTENMLKVKDVYKKYTNQPDDVSKLINSIVLAVRERAADFSQKSKDQDLTAFQEKYFKTEEDLEYFFFECKLVGKIIDEIGHSLDENNASAALDENVKRRRKDALWMLIMIQENQMLLKNAQANNFVF